MQRDDNTYLCTSGRGALGEHRSQRPPRPVHVYQDKYAEDRLQKAKKHAERKEYTRKLRRMMQDDVERDVAVQPQEDSARRRWSIEEQKRIDAVLDRQLEEQWGMDDRGGHDAFLQTLNEQNEAIDKAMMMAKHMQNMTRQKFLDAWDAFENTYYGKILTANPDMADRLKSILLQCFNVDKNVPRPSHAAHVANRRRV